MAHYLQVANQVNRTKGKAIYRSFAFEDWAPSIVESGLQLIVPSKKFGEVFLVFINTLKGHKDIICDCTEWGMHKTCRHSAAAAYWCFYNRDQISELARNQKKETLAASVLKPSNEADELDFTTIKISGLLETWMLDNTAFRYTRSNAHSKIQLISEPGPLMLFKFLKSAKVEFDISIEFDLKINYRTGCSCGANKQPSRFCEHIHAAFQFIYFHFKADFFQTFRDFTEEKNTILKEFGLSLADREAEDFKWGLNYNGDLIMTKKPDFIITKGNLNFFQQFKRVIRSEISLTSSAARPMLPGSAPLDFEVGMVFNFTSQRHIGLELESIQVREKNGKQVLKKLNTNQESNWPLLRSLDNALYELLISLSDVGLMEWMPGRNRNYFSAHGSNPWQHISPEDSKKLYARYFEQLQKHWKTLSGWPLIFILLDGKFSNLNVKPVKLSKKPVNLTFKVTMDDRFINIYSTPVIEDEDLYDGKLLRGFMYLVNDTLYLPQHADDLPLMELFRKGILKFAKEDMLEVFKTVITPLRERYPVVLPENIHIQQISVVPLPQVYLSELNEQSLMFYPKFLYNASLLEADGQVIEIVDGESGYSIIERKPEIEKSFFEFIRLLHPKFKQQHNNPYFYLPFSEVMKNNWFLKTIQTIQQAGYPVYGLQELKRFRYNTHKPTWEMKASNGNDWFDLSIKISWGEMSVPLKDIRKAISNRQDTVLLDDGTLGLLPEEWLKQYGLMLKMGEEDKGTMRISKRHFTILNDLGDELNNQEVLKEIKEKKEKLSHLENLKVIKPSRKVKAILRPYQQSGFKWLQTLDELGWGGCLADDMGLGKTLQTIAFLQFLKEKYPNSTNLVVCPTSLLYNWQNELEKFCPSMKYHIYYGQLRELGDDHFEKYDVVLTSYGLARNDVEDLIKFSWNYVVLDESQAIKNPDAVTTKAVGLLNCKNRLILSGTPVQNNTYDLYAQFNFINPGLLGNRDFFRNEFANPIDKQGDKEKAGQLRKMIYPFLLRRTKEQVAPDLPNKTETILWCEMGREQRSIYESYRKYYRDMILKKIDEVGMGKAGIYVLEGLLRLRQICDHPNLLKDETAMMDQSVKTDELLREVEENTGTHKILIFSQFVEMLQIIKSELIKRKISFSYLDGSLSADNRIKEVNRFQNDETVKVFLISLKAGGVGLNLTAADYVYIVDPWWNPAAEQQAIDRTHRIGQTRKIFAYKMICKDSVEEKILKLQDKKKLLANELVSEETGFVKKLTRDDIDFLLS